MAPERKLYQKLKKNITSISWIRLENLSLSGTPDLLGYNNSGTFFTIELNLGSGCLKLFRGSRIKELVACGFKLDACALELDACRLLLEDL